jgi:phage host-nuclease inhibitor protein Gam
MKASKHKTASAKPVQGKQAAKQAAKPIAKQVAKQVTAPAGPQKAAPKKVAAKKASPAPVTKPPFRRPPPAPVPATKAITVKEEPKPMSSPEQTPSPLAADLDRSQVLRGGAGNVDKIRDILFGSQMRDYESRFARLEETLVKENAEIRETSRRRFEQLESYVHKEFETIQARFKAERDERLDNAAQQSREVKDLGDSLSRRIRDLDDRSSNVERELRSQLMTQARDLTDEIRMTQESIVSLLEKRYHELKDGKTDRAALATLFTEVALRLSDQFRIPGSDE